MIKRWDCVNNYIIQKTMPIEYNLTEQIKQNIFVKLRSFMDSITYFKKLHHAYIRSYLEENGGGERSAPFVDAE